MQAREKSETVEYYRVLAFFAKYNNKWFVSGEGTIPRHDNTDTDANASVLERRTKKNRSSYQEVDLVKGGNQAPQQVYIAS